MKHPSNLYMLLDNLWGYIWLVFFQGGHVLTQLHSHWLHASGVRVSTPTAGV